MPTDSASQAHSVGEFCNLYGIGRTRAYAEIASGRLKARKVGARTIITAEDARAWLAALPELEPCLTEPPAQPAAA
jgi:hypothetical protein